MRQAKHQLFTHYRAFTLLECIIYIALFSLLFEGATIAFFTFSRTISRAQTIAHTENEGQFILKHLENIDTVNESGARTLISKLIESKDSLQFLSVENKTLLPDLEERTISFTITTHAKDGSIISRSFTQDSLLPL